MAKKFSDDVCYPFYEAALKCLDKNDYKQKKCKDAFEAFKKCRNDRSKELDRRWWEALKKEAQEDWLFSWMFTKPDKDQKTPPPTKEG